MAFSTILAVVGLLFFVLKFLLGKKTAPPVASYTAPTSDYVSSEEGNGKPFVTAPDGESTVRFAKRGVAASDPLTVMQQFHKAVQRKGAQPALKYQQSLGGGKYGEWVTLTWQQYYDSVQQAARALLSLGYDRHSCVNIIGFNSAEWLIANLAAIAAGGKAAGIYTTNGPEACKYIVEHSEAQFIVVEDQKQMAKFLAISKNIPLVKAVIQYREDLSAEAKACEDFKTFTWSDFMALGTSDLQEQLDGRIKEQRPTHCSTLIYTSGTTGNPKAVMMSHDNLTWTAVAFFKEINNHLSGDQRAVSYLPLSHIAAQMLDIHGPLYLAAQTTMNATVIFALPTALKGTLVASLQYARPTYFLGVPRVWEKISEKMKAAGASTKGIKKTLATWAKKQGLEGFKAMQVNGSGYLPGGYPIASAVVFKKIKAALGLDASQFLCTGAAPIAPETLEYFGSIGIHVLELYGMSESSGPHTLSFPDYFQAGSCGRLMGGADMKIDHVEGRDKEGEGEICFRGRHIMMGYMKDPKKSAEAIDPEGWLHSGDVGRFNRKTGQLFITGRIKELLITGGGENVAPVPIEDTLKANAPALANCMMVGDKRKFCSVLVCPAVELTETGGPTNKLAGLALKVGSATTLEEARTDPAWAEYLTAALKKTNSVAVSNAQKLQKYVMVPDFSVDGGELTPTLKLKRPICYTKYETEIESMYS